MRQVAILIMATGIMAGAACSGDQSAEVQLVSDDIERFWRAFDLAQQGDAVAVFNREYYEPGSPGLHQFFDARIKSVEELVAIVNFRPRYYKSLRQHTPKVEEFKPKIRAALRKFAALYPLAEFPTVYFVIGKMNSGGTTSSDAVLIGVEMYGLYPDTPLEELSDWHKAVLKPMDFLPAIVVHEVVHTQQGDPPDRTLLAAALYEGGADFLTKLVVGNSINSHLEDFADPQEGMIWAKFQKEMHGTDKSIWLYNGGQATPDWPADLAYYVGHRITAAYYQRSEDKKQAIAEILMIRDAKGFLEASQYGQ